MDALPYRRRALLAPKFAVIWASACVSFSNRWIGPVGMAAGMRWKNMIGAALAALAALAAFAVPRPASAHPHVWVTVRSHIAFTPDGNVGSIIHDWTFDEMYSSFAVQGLAQPGQLA